MAEVDPRDARIAQLEAMVAERDARIAELMAKVEAPTALLSFLYVATLKARCRVCMET
jgi:transposase